MSVTGVVVEIKTQVKILTVWSNLLMLNQNSSLAKRDNQNTWLWNGLFHVADFSGQAVSDEGVRLLPCWGCGFETRWGMDSCLLWVLCEGPITRQEQSYQLCCVTVCDLETWRRRRPWPALGCSARGKELPYVGTMRREIFTQHFGRQTVIWEYNKVKKCVIKKV
jgi:hypothetical protein